MAEDVGHGVVPGRAGAFVGAVTRWRAADSEAGIAAGCDSPSAKGVDGELTLE
ncbi:hypothetical protein OH799_17655 [Nocardia sp. NBC_00881]|uniref:hypothetical protein n=1 Tax=Nocardia sp. NBC_00881 TaxID=2975995 RepID=UPI00386386B2|nr:hypothetical protein OH799_17655 [Nocardia sp. NBC_00881]